MAVGTASAEKSLAASVDNQYDFIQDAPQLEVTLHIFTMSSSDCQMLHVGAWISAMVL